MSMAERTQWYTRVEDRLNTIEGRFQPVMSVVKSIVLQVNELKNTNALTNSASGPPLPTLSVEAKAILELLLVS